MHARRELDSTTGKRAAANCWESCLPSGLPPRPRSGHSLVADNVRGRAILFGGLGDDTDQTGDDPVLNDVWVCDLGSRKWTRLEPRGAAPPGVFGHTAELVDTRPESLTMLVYGGQVAGGLLTGDVHLLCNVYGAAAWVRVATTYPPASCLARWGHSMVSVAERPGEVSAVTGTEVPAVGGLHLIVFGGMGDGFRSLDDVLAYDVRQAVWHHLCPPGEALSGAGRRPQARRRHVAAMQGDRMWVFGGRTGWDNFHDDLWCFDLRSRVWTQVVKPQGSGVCWPPPRTGHCGALFDGRLVVFSGFGLCHTATDDGEEWNHVLYDDLWSYSIADRRWDRLTPRSASSESPGPARLPSKRDRAADSDAPLSPARQLRKLSEVQRSGGDGCTTPRRRSMAAAFVHDNRLYIHGGRDQNLAFDCFFSLPFAPRMRSLVEFAGQHIVDSGTEYSEQPLPSLLSAFLDSLFLRHASSNTCLPPEADPP
eukprot:TRINITY_DN3989_c1_g1_i1.p1 TRINITY_DN3989_c1_g1~~TRINITY_DN3989_c1_g1_i1.p1  ORF type:complete len:518 (+),score=113.57 TRINITY_DN3989_c1_g1_i1:116-1555(+)